MTDRITEQPFCQTRVICSALSSDEWRRLAGHIDTWFSAGLEAKTEYNHKIKLINKWLN